jgi:hypothetical protein
MLTVVNLNWLYVKHIEQNGSMTRGGIRKVAMGPKVFVPVVDLLKY